MINIHLPSVDYFDFEIFGISGAQKFIKYTKQSAVVIGGGGGGGGAGGGGGGFLAMMVVFILTNRTDTDVMPHSAALHMGTV